MATTSIDVYFDYTPTILPAPNFTPTGKAGGGNVMRYEIDQTTGTFKVFEPGYAAGPTYPALPTGWIPGGITQYQIDYLLVHYDEMIRREIEKNPEVIYDSNFQNFMKWVMEFRRIVLEARQDIAHGLAVPPFKKDTGVLPKGYACTGGHKFDATMINDINKAIVAGLDPKIYDPTKFIGSAYVDVCSVANTLNLVTDVILGTQQSWDTYITAAALPPPKPINHLLNFSKEFESVMTETNNQIINGDYRNRYDIIENLLKDTIGFLRNLTEGCNTELNIIEHSSDISSFYEQVNFTEKDVDGSLVVPKDMADMVDKNKIMADLTKSVNKYAKMASSANVIANAYNINTGVHKFVSSSAKIANLLKSLGTVGKVITPSQEILDLTMTKIYTDGDQKFAKYLDDTAVKALKLKQKTEQENYLDRFDKEAPRANPKQVISNRVARYEEHYPKIDYFIGGTKKSPKYQLEKKSNQTVTITQNGGRKIEINEIIKSNKESDQNIKEISTRLKSIDELYKLQNERYFENNHFMDLDNLQQKNEFLIEMMNVIILHNFLISQKTAAHSTFFHQMNDKIADFKKNLTDLWDVMSSRVDIEAGTDDSVLNRLLANGMVTMAEIDKLITSIGINPVTTNIGFDEILNRLGTSKVIAGLIDKYGLGSFGLVVSDLERIIRSNPKTLVTKGKSIQDIYSGLFSYYTDLKNTHNALLTQYRSLDTTTFDMSQIKQFTGDVIESNINTANTFIHEMISVLENFGVKTDMLQGIRTEMGQSKRRIADFEDYSKQTLQKLRSKEGVLNASHDTIMQDLNTVGQADSSNFTGKEMSEFYKNFVTNYVEKLANASGNVVKYYNYEKDKKYVDERTYILHKNLLEVNILGNAIYQNWDDDSTRQINVNDIMTVVGGTFDNYLLTFIQKFNNSTNLMGTILFFPQIMQNIRQGTLVDLILSFCVPKSSIIKSVINRYLTFDASDKLILVPGMKRSDQLTLAHNLADAFKKYAVFVNKYRTASDATETHRDDGSNPEFIIHIINMYQEAVYKLPDSDNFLQALVGYLLRGNDVNYDETKIITNINERLVKIYDQYNGTLSRDDFDSKVINEIKAMTTSILELFTEKLVKQYQLFDSLILINNSMNPYFAQIQQDQQDSVKLLQESDKIKLVPEIEHLESFKQIIDPKWIPAVPTAGIRYFTNNTSNTTNPALKTLYNNINTSNQGTSSPFLLMSARPQDHANFNLIHNTIIDLDTTVKPILTMMKRILDDGQTITNSGTAINYQFNIIQANTNLYSNPFIYTTPMTPGLVNKKNLFSNTSNVISSLILNPTSGVFEFYIPVHTADSIGGVNGAGQITTYNLNAETFNINIQNNSTDLINVPVGSDITINDVSNAIKLLNTGRYLVDFMEKLYGTVEDIKDLKIETNTTWDQDVSRATTTYTTRLDKKTRLLNTLDVLDQIQNTIRNNVGKYMHLDKALIETSNPANRNAISDAISRTEAANPEKADFNGIIDLVWLFARKLVNAWYSLFGHMLTNFIVQEAPKKLIEFAKMLKINTDKILKMKPYKPFIENLRSHTTIVDNELSQKKTQIVTLQSDYPIEVDPASRVLAPFDKYFIQNSTLDTTKYDSYYSNFNEPSTQIYFLIALIESDFDDQIKKPLAEINIYANQIVKLVDTIESYLDPARIRGYINLVDPASVTDYKKLYNPGFMTIHNQFKPEIEASLKSIQFDSLFNDIVNEFNGYNADLKSNVVDPADLTPAAFAALANPNTKPLLMNLGGPLLSHLFMNATVDPNDYLYYKYQLKNGPNKLEAVEKTILLYISNLYRIVLNIVTAKINELSTEIINRVSLINVQKLDLDIELSDYFGSKKINGTGKINVAFPVFTNANKDHIHMALFGPGTYQIHKNKLGEINDTVKTITTSVKKNMIEVYKKELAIYQNLNQMDIDIRHSLSKSKMEIQERVQRLDNMIQVISQVMFNPYYKRFAFVDNTKLLNHVNGAIENFETIWRLIEQKIYGIVTKNNAHILALSQIVNYEAFKSTIDKLIGTKAVVEKIYKRMSFGLIEYYYDVLDSILTCLSNKPFEEMSEIESYLYQHHYISLKRCYVLFRWIRQEYLPNKQAEDDANKKAGITFTPILGKKIEVLKTSRDVNLIFIEFQGIRKFLDDYSAVAMSKVQLHLRINDFVSDDYNKRIDAMALARGITPTDVDFMKDYSPTSSEYEKRWDNNKMMFINENNMNVLKVDFDLLQNVYQFNNPNKTRDFSIYYSGVYNKMKPNPVGIEFNRIYNTKIYPDSDVISNYMSIAPNIMNGKGTVIMTYGYSGVGKSASLFGRDASSSKPVNGIMQATMDQFSNVKIYFRVFEIYGLGVQYNYYWNPDDNGVRDCLPNFTQCIIHHVLDASGSVLQSQDQIVFTNRHDMMAYIMDLKDPENGTHFPVNEKNSPNLGGKKKNYNTYFDATNKMINSTYVEINATHYSNFGAFTKDIDRARMDGITIQKLLSHVVSQVKGTVNNPESSRSILVYDFEIQIDPTDDIFVPFLIYDLPGKEDIARTYIDTTITSSMDADVKKRVFKDIAGDPSRTQKNTYTLNPILAPIFNNNVDIMVNLLKSISNTGPGIINPGGGTPVKFGPVYENGFIKDILDYQITNFNYKKNASGSYDYVEGGANYQVKDLYKTGIAITNFGQLLDSNNFKPDFYSTAPNYYFNLMFPFGIISAESYVATNKINKEIVTKELLIMVCTIIVAFLIKRQLFDIVVELINRFVEPGGSTEGPDAGQEGTWTRNKIYAFFEAFYINENVVGLLQYLIRDILGKEESTIDEQDTVTEDMRQTVNNYYSTATRYRALFNINKVKPGGTVGNNYELKVNDEFLDSKNDKLKEMEINEYTNKNIIPGHQNIFAVKETPIGTAIEHMNNTIAFENKGNYDSNKIFRSGKRPYNCTTTDTNGNDVSVIFNPKQAVNPSLNDALKETNRPLLQDFIEPYEQKIAFYYVFYVVSNGQMQTKAEEQVKLLNNSMPFINEMDPSSKKQRCST